MNLIRLFILFLFPTLLFAQRPGFEQGKLKLSFGSESEVVISGSSNVTGFTCIYQQDISCRGLVVEGDFEKNAIVLSNATLSLESCGFDCGNILMNKDFRHTIKSKEHPEILMEIHELHFECRPEKDGEEVKVKALVHLTVAGVKKVYSINAKSTLSENNLFVTGLFSVYMTDFCLSPPSLMFGMVTVDPILEIGFHFVLSN
ncbi:MAG: hypothetical protein RIC15_10805 [Vicingaceae bacterium]